MEGELNELNSKELRALLRQETRKFLLLLESESTIEELEVLRSRIHIIGDILKEKEMQYGENSDI
jgi:hypothetical protein